MYRTGRSSSLRKNVPTTNPNTKAKTSAQKTVRRTRPTREGRPVRLLDSIGAKRFLDFSAEVVDEPFDRALGPRTDECFDRERSDQSTEAEAAVEGRDRVSYARGTSRQTSKSALSRGFQILLVRIDRLDQRVDFDTVSR